jgi:hypothetical protein
MIIITENKKNHYLIKNFYDEINKQKLKETRLNQTQGGAHTQFNLASLDNNDTVIDYPAYKDDDTEVIHTDTIEDKVEPEDLEYASKLKSKMKKILNIALGGLTVSSLAASMFFNANLPQQEKEALDLMAHQNNMTVEQMINQSKAKSSQKVAPQTTVKNINSQEKTKKTLTKPIKNKRNDRIKEISIERIKEFENFKPFPYQDRSGVSIGFGTQFMTKGNAGKLKKDGNWKDIIYKKLGYSDAKIKELKKDKKYIDNVKKEIKKYVASIEERIDELEERKNSKVGKTNRYRFPKKERKRLDKKISHLKSRIDAAYDRGVLTLEEAIKCFELDVQEAYNKAKSDFKNAFEKMHLDVIIVIIDMNYNVGLFFLQKVYTDFNKHLVNYSEEIIKEKPDIKKTIAHLKLAAKEISPKGAPTYYRQNRDRATENYKLLLGVIEELEASINENNSLKNIYKNLFS